MQSFPVEIKDYFTSSLSFVVSDMIVCLMHGQSTLQERSFITRLNEMYTDTDSITLSTFMNIKQT